MRGRAGSLAPKAFRCICGVPCYRLSIGGWAREIVGLTENVLDEPAAVAVCGGLVEADQQGVGPKMGQSRYFVGISKLHLCPARQQSETA